MTFNVNECKLMYVKTRPRMKTTRYNYGYFNCPALLVDILATALSH